MAEPKAGASSLPSFLQRSDNSGYDEIPAAPLVLAALVVIGFVGYAMRYLSKEQAESSAKEVAQAQKRAARKAKKGKPLTEADVVEDPDSESLGALKAGSMWLISLIRDAVLLAAVLVLVMEAWRFIPRARVLPCHHVLGRPDDGTNCVLVPGMEDPLECTQASRPSPRGTFPTFEQHVTRNCFSAMPHGVLRPSTRYHWDTKGASWYKRGFLESLFYRPWWTTQFVSPHKDGGASVAIIQNSFQAQLSGFYSVYNSTVLEDPDKIPNIVAKRDALKTAAAKLTFEAKTLAALHTKYKTGMMGAQISPIEGGLDCAGAAQSSFQFVLARGLWERWQHVLVDVLPDLYYFVSPAQY